MAKKSQSYYSRRNPFFTVHVDYDFARDGGATGDIDLGGDLPTGTVVLGGYLRVITAPTSGGAATLAIKTEAADDIVAAAVVAGAPWSTTGLKSIVPIGSGATMKRMTARRSIVATVGTAALTAGAFEVVLLCAKI